MMQRLWYILSILSSVITYGQVTVFTEVNSKEAKINEPLVLTVVQEVVGENMEQQTPLQLMDLSKFDILGNASERNTFIDPRKGIKINQLIYQVYLQPKVAGRIKIGSALVTVNGKIYKSEPFEVSVKDADRKVEGMDYLSKEVFLNLEVEDKVLYENQPTVAVLRAFSKNFDNFRKLENIQTPKQLTAEVKPISFKKKDIESEEGDYVSQIVGTFLIFPKRTGALEIEPISALLKTPEISKVISNKVKLNVKTLPQGAPSHFKNSVGEFKVKLNSVIDNKNIEVGKPIEVNVTLSGKGNLDKEQLPKIIPTDAYEVFRPQFVQHLGTDEEGLHGEIIAKYVIIPKKQGALKIATERFSYFNPIQNNYVDLGNEELILNVFSSQQIAANKTTMDMMDDYTKVVMETVKLPTEKNQKASHFTFNMKYILINMGLMIGGLLLLFLMYKLRSRPKKTKTFKPLSNTNVSEEEVIIRSKMKPDFEEYFDALQMVKNEGNYEAFFKTYSEFHVETEKWVEKNFNIDLTTYIEGYYGNYFSQEYSELVHLIAVEKYAPVHDASQIDEFYTRIVAIYGQITKD